MRIKFIAPPSRRGCAWPLVGSARAEESGNSLGAVDLPLIQENPAEISSHCTTTVMVWRGTQPPQSGSAVERLPGVLLVADVDRHRTRPPIFLPSFRL